MATSCDNKPITLMRGNYILDLAGANVLNRKGYEPDDLPVTPEMLHAGVEALSEFEPGDGSTAAEIVSSVFIRMLAEAPLAERRPNWRPMP